MAKHKEKPKLKYNLPHKNRKHKNVSVTRRAYTYDGRGNLTGEEENGELLHGYEYGAINRLTRAHNSRGEGRDGLQELHYYLQDELGSPLRVSTTEGYLTYGYDEFGNDLERNWKRQVFQVLIQGREKGSPLAIQATGMTISAAPTLPRRENISLRVAGL